MTMQTPATPNENSLENNWGLIESSRSQMSTRIARLADSMSGIRAKQLRSISRWLSGSGGFVAALERPDVLCFCQPWVEAVLVKPEQGQLSDADKVAAISKGVCKFEIGAASPVSLTPFVYPTVAFLAWTLLIAFGSIFVLPGFEEMYAEFGIELPRTTLITFAVGRWFRSYWILFFAVMLLVPIVSWVLLKISQQNTSYSLGWIDRRLVRFNTKLSFWVNHVANLLTAGVDDSDAIRIAGRCSASTRLQGVCNGYSCQEGDHLLPATYPLINNSLLLKNRVAKIAILEETARYYRSHGRVVQGWWLAWLGRAIVVLMWLTIAVSATSLFMPLISIVSGLTGG
jgi:hypothetical protein